MAQFNDKAREHMVNALFEPLDYLHYPLEFPIPYRGKSYEEAVALMAPMFTQVEDLGMALRHARAVFGTIGLIGTDVVLRLPAISQTGATPPWLEHYGIGVDKYNRRVSRDWLLLRDMPQAWWPQSRTTLTVDIGTPLGFKVLTYWLEYMAVDNVIAKAKSFIGETFRYSLNTPGQIARAWPTVAPYLPDKWRQQVANQTRRSQLPPKFDITEFRPRAAKVEELLAKAMLLEQVYKDQHMQVVIR